MSVKGNIVLNYYDSIVYEEDLQLLEGPHWLNDTLIGFYMDYLENEEYNNLDICFVRPEVTQCIKLSPDLPIFLDPIEFRRKSFAVMTLNDCINPNSPGGSHWSLLIFSRNELKFYHIDSSEGTNKLAAKELAAKITEYIGKNIKCDFESLKSLQQTNSYDCGVFVLCNLDNVLNHIFRKKKLSTLEPVSEVQVSKKREELKKLIINLYRREYTKAQAQKAKDAKQKSIKGEDG